METNIDFWLWDYLDSNNWYKSKNFDLTFD